MKLSLPFENRSTLVERNAHLNRIATELKQELFGIDEIIDRVIESVRAWFVMPHIIRRPVIVCLWGLTGTGKTQLSRRLAQKLGFYDRFVEVQMDGFSHGQSWRSQDSISAMLAESGIEEGQPGILMLDEFQRFRTVSSKGDDIAVKRYQDVWQLLSDGKLPPSLSFLQQLESTLAYSEWDADNAKDEELETNGEDSVSDESSKKSQKKKRKFQLAPYEARELKRSLKLTEDLQTIMTWSSTQIQEKVRVFRASSDQWETDYSRLLVIVAGNLDEMYSELASRVADCDSDADLFHQFSKELSVIDVKKALKKRFRPEQVSRLGNSHIIYPSMNRKSYLQLINSICANYVNEMYVSSGFSFQLDPSVVHGIYVNGVFPAQGTRPVFSSVHSILSAALVNAALWATENSVDIGSVIAVALDIDAQRLTMTAVDQRSVQIPITLEIDQIRKKSSSNFRALLAVHEAGHGLVYATLFGQAPQEIKINVASFEGGYNSYTRLKAESRQNILDRICVSLSGRAAEQMVFGSQACSSGSYYDFKRATNAAAQFIRHEGFADQLSHVDVSTNAQDDINTDIAPTNAKIEAVLQEQMLRAQQLLIEYKAAFQAIVQLLMVHGQVSPQQMAELLGVSIASEGSTLTAYASLLEAFYE
jgi:Peptidase family M41/ATPase family associated with various cellular activities (AAA)